MYIYSEKPFFESSSTLTNFHTSHPKVSCTYSSLGTFEMKRVFKKFYEFECRILLDLFNNFSNNS